MTKMFAVLIAAALLAACNGEGIVPTLPITPSTPPPPVATEATIEWVSTEPAQESVVPYNDWNISTNVRCSVPERYKDGFVACLGLPSVDGINWLASYRPIIKTAPLNNMIFMTQAMMSSGWGITRTEYIIIEAHFYPKSDPNKMEIIARGPVVRWPLNYR